MEMALSVEQETGNETKAGTEQPRNGTSKSLVEQRSNIYDNDEFDVFRRKDVDLNRIHIGKKYVYLSLPSHITLHTHTLNRYDPDSASVVLDDKTVVDFSRDRYKTYEIETQWSYVSEEDAHQLQVGGAEGVANTEMLDMLGMRFGMQFDLYNDEYDDTYDSQNVGAADNDSADELLSVQRCVIFYHMHQTHSHTHTHTH